MELFMWCKKTAVLKYMCIYIYTCSIRASYKLKFFLLVRGNTKNNKNLSAYDILEIYRHAETKCISMFVKQILFS